MADNYSGGDMARVVWGLAKAGISGEGAGEILMSTVLHKSIPAVADCTPGEMVQLVWGAAAGGVGIRSAGAVMERIWPVTSEISGDLSADELAMVLWAYLVSGYRSPSFITMIISRLQSLLVDSFSTSGAAPCRAMAPAWPLSSSSSALSPCMPPGRAAALAPGRPLPSAGAVRARAAGATSPPGTTPSPLHFPPIARPEAYPQYDGA